MPGLFDMPLKVKLLGISYQSNSKALYEALKLDKEAISMTSFFAELQTKSAAVQGCSKLIRWKKLAAVGSNDVF